MTEQPGERPTEPTQPAEASAHESPDPAPQPPPASSAPTPAESAAAPAAPTAASSGTPGKPYDVHAATRSLQGADPMDLGIVAAGVVAFFASMMPFYTASVSGGGFDISAHISAWHGFFGWFAALVALAGGVIVALGLFDVSLPVAVHQAAVVAFGVALLCLALALFITPGGGCNGAGGLGIDCDTGRGFGYWLALLAVLAGLGMSLARARTTMEPRAA
jgi:hypothetical protein